MQLINRFMLLLFVPLVAWAGDETKTVLKLDETIISGNQEVPGVLYIVPWKPVRQQPVSEALMEQVPIIDFSPIDPVSFRTEIQYRQQIKQLTQIAENP